MSGSGATSNVSARHTYDVFISHAGEDKQTVAIPLANELERRGFSVWLDERRLTIGDPLFGGINDGLRESRFGVVIISKRFLKKYWPRNELEALVALEAATSEKVILPVWHGLTYRQVARRVPILAGRLAANTSSGIPAVADDVESALRAAARGTTRGTGSRALPSPRGRRGRLATIPVLLACSVLAVVAALAAARLTKDEASPDLTDPASSAALRLRYPADWRKLDEPRAPVQLRDAVAVGPAPDAHLTVGISAATGPTLLPRSLQRRASGERRSSLGRLPARRFVIPAVGPGESSLVVLAAPTTIGVVTAVCASPPAEAERFHPICERVAQTIELKRGTSFALGPDPAYAARLSSVLRTLSGKRVGARSRLARARTPERQAAAAEALRAAFSRAAARIRHIATSPADRGQRDRLVTALTAAAGRYRDLRRAASSGDGDAFTRHVAGVRTVERRVLEARRSHRQIGYTIKR